MVEQAAVPAHGLVQALALKGVGVGDGRKLVKPRAHVQLPPLEAKGQVHRAAGLVRRGVQPVQDGPGHEFLREARGLFVRKVRVLGLYPGKVVVVEGLLHALGAQAVVDAQE